jgi:hypothetical protein
LRKLLTVLVATGGCIALGGCFTGSEPRLADGFGLHFQDEGSDVKLAYGLADSDDVALMLQCSKGAGEVQVTDVARDSARPVLVLASSDGVSVLSASLQPNPEGQAPLLAAQTSVASPALAAFRRTGRISVRNGDFRYGITATGDERAAVGRFFAACGPARSTAGGQVA